MELNWIAISTVATAVMAILTLLTLWQNRNQLKELRRQWKESQNPCLSITMTGINGGFYLKVVNIGFSTAVNTRFIFEDSFLNKQDSDKANDNKQYLTNLRTNGIDILNDSPIYIPTFLNFYQLENFDLNLEVHYKNIQGEDFNSILKLNIDSLKYIEYRDHYELECSKTMKEIKKSLLELTQTIHKQHK